MLRPLVAMLLLTAPGALAHSIGAEASVARGFLSLNLTGDVELRPDKTYLALCYGLSRPPQLEGYSAEGVTIPAFSPAPTHQFCVGADHALNERWYLAVMGTLSPQATDRIGLGSTDQRALLTSRRSQGASFSMAFDSAGFSDYEFLLDGSLSLTHHQLGRGIATATRPRLLEEPMWVFRPSLGGTLFLHGKTELSLRGSYFAYSADPLTVGRFTDSELASLEKTLRTAASRLTTNVELLRRSLAMLQGRMLQADAVSGFAAAPIQWEGKLSATYKFTPWLRGQLSYVFDRYAPTQGHAQIFSTKWIVRPADSFRFWAALSVQRDEPLDDPSSRSAGDLEVQTSGLVTVGAELSF